MRESEKFKICRGMVREEEKYRKKRETHTAEIDRDRQTDRSDNFSVQRTEQHASNTHSSYLA